MTTPRGTTEQPGREQGGGDRVLRGSISLGRWHGVEVDAHWTVFVTVGIFTIALATDTLPRAHPGDPHPAYWLVAVVSAVALVLSLLLHELAHALVARANDIEVRRITLWLLGGVTELGDPSPTARADALVAAAGPLTSLAFGLGAALLAFGVGTAGLVGTALVWLATVSVLLAAFNLLPGAPLDGGRLLRALLWWRYQERDRATERAARAGRLLGLLLIGMGMFELLVGVTAGLWLALVGWYILSGANAEQAAAADEHLAELEAVDVMTPVEVVAPAWWTVEQFVGHLSPTGIAPGVFPVVDIAGHTTGICTVADLDTVPAARRADTRLGSLSARHVRPLVVAPNARATELAGQIRARRGVALVEVSGRPVGVVTEVELGRAAHLTVLGWRTGPHTG